MDLGESEGVVLDRNKSMQLLLELYEKIEKIGASPQDVLQVFESYIFEVCRQNGKSVTDLKTYLEAISRNYSGWLKATGAVEKEGE